MSSWSKSFLVVLVFLFLSSPRCQAQTFDDAGLWLAMFAQPTQGALSTPTAIFALALMTAFCLLLLNLKVRPYEIVRG